ncbi:TPA: hypothetical protein PES99_001204 [Staphylococcus aureus]|uniref:hypothetical protein n=1 Tax=Staphylococcus aureus TaxID=1280 RepID=UPI000B800E8B|nr:hypothetical protein [Staphylococcus aureus]MBY0864049.1 hypothetical protein [Staphylococcus aureus]OXL88363.1 hypothetical protein CA803_14330 [Staphylococcus aureus]HDF6355164.1 hypothetical protein [Staphylococcus aureus]
MKKHGAENVDYITDEQSAIRHFRAQSKVFKDERDEYKKQRDELIGDIAKLRERNKDLEKKASAWDRHCKSVEKDLINEFGNDDERVKFGMELNNKISMEAETNE